MSFVSPSRSALRRSAGGCLRISVSVSGGGSGSARPSASGVQLQLRPRAAAAAALGRRALSSSAAAAGRGGATAAAAAPAARKQLKDLPDKALVRTGPLGRLAKVLSPRIAAHITTRVGSSFGGNHSLEWQTPPHNVLLVQKRDAKASEAAVRIAEYLAREQPHMNVIAEEKTFAELHQRLLNLVLVRPEERKLLSSKVDIILTLGGDGTILHASSLFDDCAVPPVLSFSMGTLGFLLPYHIESFPAALNEIFKGKASLLLRMRLHLTKHAADGRLLPTSDGRLGDVHLMNEVTLHRGREPHLTMIDAFVDGRHLTQAISDGLIVATPTGSTAYSLSAGGPIVHPAVQNLILTPICPRSLSFRTVLLPSDSSVQLKVSRTSRTPAELTVDGRDMGLLRPGEFLQVGMSPFPIPCVNRSSPSSASSSSASSSTSSDASPTGTREEPPLLEYASDGAGESGGGAEGQAAAVLQRSERGEDDWVRDINTLLKFNTSFGKLPNE